LYPPIHRLEEPEISAASAEFPERLRLRQPVPGQLASWLTVFVDACIMLLGFSRKKSSLSWLIFVLAFKSGGIYESEVKYIGIPRD
jgi:hypothetical protein